MHALLDLIQPPADGPLGVLEQELAQQECQQRQGRTGILGVGPPVPRVP